MSRTTNTSTVGRVDIDDTTSSTNTTTGALVVDGGVGIAENLNVGGNAVVTGNLTVNGTTTSVQTTNTEIKDPNIVLNDGGSDATSEGSGITIERTGTDGSLVYEDALASKFKAGALGSEIELANVSSAQTLSSKTLTSPVVNTSISGTAVLDDDTMATASATTIATSESIKAYVDSVTSASHTQNTDTGTNANTFTVGDNADTDKKIEADNGDANNPFLMYDASANEWVFSNDGTTTASIGSGGGAGGINYIVNTDIESDASGYSIYDDGSSPPTDGAGAGATALSVARNTTTPLRGTGDLKISKNSTISNGEGVAYDFTIDEADKTAPMIISFNYNTTANYADNSLQIYVYDVTNARMIESTPRDLESIGFNGSYVGQFQASSDSTSYRLLFHSNDLTTNTWDVQIDNVFVGPASQYSGISTPVTDWESFTPTGTWTTNTTYTGQWRRVGDSAEIALSVATSGVPTTADLTVNLPSGLVIDTAKLGVSANSQVLGSARLDQAGTTSYVGNVTYESTTSIRFRHTESGNFGNVNQANPFAFNANDKATAIFKAPISGWSSTVTSGAIDSGRDVAFQGGMTSPQSVGTSFTSMTIDTVTRDSHSAYSGTTYTISESGDYIIGGVGGFWASTTVEYRAYLQAQLVTADLGTITPVLTGLQKGTTSGGQERLEGGSVIYHLKKGDTVTFGGSISSGSLNIYYSRVFVQKVSGRSSQALADEKVHESRYGTATQAVSNGTTVTFNTVVKSTHGALGSDGVFTAPRVGVVKVNAQLVTQGVASGAIDSNFSCILRKNATTKVWEGSRDYSYDGTRNRPYTSQLSAEVYVNKGDTLEIEFSEDIAAVNLATGAYQNIVSFTMD